MVSWPEIWEDYAPNRVIELVFDGKIVIQINQMVETNWDAVGI